MIYAMFAMVVLTFMVGIVAVVTRVKSVKNGSVKIKYYRTMDGQEVPEQLTKSTRCFNNMFEVPVLFYVVSTLFVILKTNNELALLLAWVFVGFRIAQAIVHLTYNNVLHRMLMFWGAVISVLSMWVILLIQIA
ncbi:MAPEG family protein [Pseudoalteromonas sp. G4]|uniref:MAPEG family protein n=1 Tax=Pseudoalteromonas sp. G4 TaxID=2992761 RepID=UPI00237DBAB0|nr:MAPEG family protein [Pseudoalteromonas sp. G4]MDE3270962.1 MAPEG family protein [Pseudoalteromonas sp. G4]